MKNMAIKIENLSKNYQMGEVSIPAVKEISLEIEDGEFLVILGASGSGKTTLLNLLGAIDKPSTGSIKFQYERQYSIESLKEKELTLFRRNYIGFIFQFYNLAGDLTALENVELAARLTHSSKNAEKIAQKLLEEVELGDKFNKFPSQLSGGEQQRVAIARALAKNPKIILADEPTGNIDSKMTVNLMKIFKQINKDHKVTVIIVTHNEKLASLADRVINLQDGRIKEMTMHDDKKEREFWDQYTNGKLKTD